MNTNWLTGHLYPYAAGHKRELAAGAAISCVLAGLNYINLQLIRRLFDERLYLDTPRQLVILLCAVCAAVLFYTFLNWYQARLKNDLVVSINRDMIGDFYGRICRMPPGFFNSHSPGRLLTLLLNDITQVTPLIPLLCIDLGKNLLIMLLLAVYLVRMQWQVAVFYAVLAAGHLAVAEYFARRTRRLLPETQKTREGLHNKLLEYFQVIPLLRIYDAGGRERQKVTRLNDLLADQNKRILGQETAKDFFQDCLALCFICAFILAGYRLVGQGAMSAGKFVSILVASYLLNGYVRALFEIYGRTRQLLVHADRLRDAFSGKWSPDPEAQYGSAKSRAPMAGPVRSVVFRDVRFSYDRSVVLNGVSCALAGGCLTGLTGESGCGKSTMLNLLLRSAVPGGGEILVNSTPLQEVDGAWYRGQLAYLPQNSLLFNGTIAENIAFGADKPDMRKVAESARLAAIHDFITSLPQGYETRIETGATLMSEGEKKRIEIARALYKDSSLILLDEPTAALDIRNKVALLEALKALKDRLVVIASHDLGVLERCDKILLLNAKKEAVPLESCAEVYRYYAKAAEANPLVKLP